MRKRMTPDEIINCLFNMALNHERSPYNRGLDQTADILRNAAEIIRTTHLGVESITNADGGPLPILEINERGQVVAMHENDEKAPATESCNGCKFFKSAGAWVGEKCGQCRRYPPSPDGKLPHVYASGLCGEFKRQEACAAAGDWSDEAKAAAQAITGNYAVTHSQFKIQCARNQALEEAAKVAENEAKVSDWEGAEVANAIAAAIRGMIK